MNISIFGLGYVGAVSLGCLAKLGHNVIGIDANPEKVQFVLDAKSPVIEAGLDELISQGVADGRISATHDVREAVRNSDISMICVGTPSRRDGSLDMHYVTRVCADIGAQLASKQSRHIVVIRSTVLPGYAHEFGSRVLGSASGLTDGKGFGVSVNPEFLREGSAVADFFGPPFTLVGSDLASDANRVLEIYEALGAPHFLTDINTASMVKYACNAFHALKVTFANEIGAVCNSLDIDSHHVMDIVCADKKLNISPAYLRPGFAFGGSCLPKDLRALVDSARQRSVQIPTIQSLLPSNDLQVKRFVDEVVELKKRKIAILGLAFKEGTDDLRESPMVTVAESLYGKGHSIRIYDRYVSISRLTGSNRSYIETEIPHIASMMAEDIRDALHDSEVVIIGNRNSEYVDAIRKYGSHATVMDLVRISDDTGTLGLSYRGIAW